MLKSLTLNNSNNILVVGDGDLGFSAALVAQSSSSGPKLLIATVFEGTQEELEKKYLHSSENIDILHKANAEVLFGVDARCLHNTPHLQGRSFDVIVFNFPHVGWQNSPNHHREIEMINDNSLLVSMFFSSAFKVCHNGSFVCVTHKSCYPYSEWGIKESAYQNGLTESYCCETFDEEFWRSRNYIPKRGDGPPRLPGKEKVLRQGPVSWLVVLFFLSKSRSRNCVEKVWHRASWERYSLSNKVGEDICIYEKDGGGLNYRGELALYAGLYAPTHRHWANPSFISVLKYEMTWLLWPWHNSEKTP